MLTARRIALALSGVGVALLLATAPASGQTVKAGEFCSPAGSTGATSTGLILTCTTTPTDSRLRFRDVGGVATTMTTTQSTATTTTIATTTTTQSPATTSTITPATRQPTSTITPTPTPAVADRTAQPAIPSTGPVSLTG